MPKEKKPGKEFVLKTFLVQTLRGAFRKTPMYQEAKNRAKEEYFVPSKTGKPMRRIRYICASCNGRFFDKPGTKEIAVDHIIPIIQTNKNYKTLHEFIIDFVIGLFCSIDNLQILCNYAGERDGKKSCHKIKTANERKEAATFRKENK
jgi:5-methylcytosine-specific restriction endonuclease McrA